MKMPNGLLCLTIFAGAICLGASAQSSPNFDHDYLERVQQNPNLASPGCQACRNSCVNHREQCKSLACSHAGGKNKGVQCDTGGNPGWNQQRFENELKACTENEKTCWNQCEGGACRR